jgi:hypothetical protein
MGGIVLAISLLATYVFIVDGLHDPYVGPAIYKEMGPNHVTLAYVSPVVIAIAASLGFFLSYRSKQRL